MTVPAEIRQAAASGRALRVRTSDGEVLVADVLRYDEEELVCAVLTSTHPERYAICDSVGLSVRLRDIEKLQIVDRPRRLRPLPPR